MPDIFEPVFTEMLISVFPDHDPGRAREDTDRLGGAGTVVGIKNASTER
jgi:hypothetical protein